ncbi:MAG: flagellar biosynthesis protein FlhB [Thermodesulfobacteriota bacterium]
MAEESPAGGERTEAPSAKRRQDFRKKGQVAQSKEITTAALMTVTLLFWLFYMPKFWHGLSELISSIWQNIHTVDASIPAIVGLGYYVVQQSALLLAPLLALVVIVAFFSSFFQFGWLLTAYPLTPDIKKLDPIKGMGRIFSKRSVVEIIKSVFKVGLVGWVAYSTVLNHFEEALVLIDTSAGVTISFLAKTAALVLAKICGVLIFLAFLDFLYVRWEMEEKMKMTKQELKEEFKESEGDPHVKSQIRAIQQEMARKRMMAEVPGADVVVTNPTHLSVAVRYDKKTMDAPKVIAKGSGHIAMKIREIARDNDVPLVENPPVARLLHNLDLGATVPEEMFKAVAEILAHVYSLKQRRP